jgi:hypothetical protein
MNKLDIQNIEAVLTAQCVKSDNKLELYVLQDLLDQNDPIQYAKDILSHGCSGGSCSGLIYYTDTKAFYIKFIDEIEELKNEMEESTGENLSIGSPMYNWLAWFGYEEMLRKVADNIGLEY